MTFEEHIRALLGDLAFKLASAATANDALTAERDTLQAKLKAANAAPRRTPAKNPDGRGNR